MKKHRSEIDLNRLELNVALQLEPYDGNILPTTLASIGVEDLHDLRREVNRRILPDGYSRRNSGTATADLHENCPLPRREAEAELAALGARILDLLALKSVFVVLDDSPIMHVPEPYRKLLVNGAHSVASLGQGEPCVGTEGAKQTAFEGPRCELLRAGGEPVIATAPHNAFLRRDGHAPHALEENTSSLAQQFARELKGSALCWARMTQWRTEFRHALGQRSKMAAGGAVDVLNNILDRDNAIRDPNYLLTDELAENLWFGQLRDWASGRNIIGRDCSLHLDVHGCLDPPRHPAYAMLGLGAMRQYAEGLTEGSSEKNLATRRMDAFAQALQRSVPKVLSLVLGVSATEAATLTGLAPPPVDKDGVCLPTLSGAWPPNTGRLTMTQQSVIHCGVTHALQLELGWSLRRKLMKDQDAVSRLALAIRNAWLEALRDEAINTRRKSVSGQTR